MKRRIEGFVLALSVAGLLAGCHRADSSSSQQSARPGKSPGVTDPRLVLGQMPGQTPDTPVGPRAPAPAGGMMPSGANPDFSANPGPRPLEPKADETVRGRYTSPGGTTVEIAGVCRVTEDSISCWSPDGSKNKDLEKRVEDALTNRTRFGGQNLSFAYKKKNRVVIVKTVWPPMGNGMGGGVNLMSIGSPSNGYSGGFQLNDFSRPVAYDPRQPRESYEARTVSVDPNVDVTSAYFNVTETSPKEGTLELHKGAKCTIEDASLTVESISKGPGPMGMRGWPVSSGSVQPHQEEQWTIEVKLGNPSSKYRLNVSVGGSRGALFVGPNGRIVDAREYEQAMMARNQAMMETSKRNPDGSTTVTNRKPAMEYRPVNCFVNFTGGPHMSYTINADPKFVKRLTVRATKSKLVELKGVRLDPD